MPFKGKKQMGKFFAMEARGELPKGTARRWARHTPDIKSLPLKKKLRKRKKRVENKSRAINAQKLKNWKK